MKASKEIKKHLKTHNWTGIDLEKRTKDRALTVEMPKKYNHRKIRRLLNEIIGASHQLQFMEGSYKHSPYPEDRDEMKKRQIAEMRADLNAARRDLKKEAGE